MFLKISFVSHGRPTTTTARLYLEAMACPPATPSSWYLGRGWRTASRHRIALQSLTPPHITAHASPRFTPTPPPSSTLRAPRPQTFFALFNTMYLLRRTTCPSLEKLVIIAALFGGSAAVAVSRVYLGYHTERQVLAGLTVGVVTGAVWWVVYEVALEPIGRAVCKSWLGRALLLRDYSRVPNQAAMEWQQLEHWNKVDALKAKSNAKPKAT